MSGFSRPNLLYMRMFAEAWTEEAIVQQAVGQSPWGHNLVLLTKLKETEARLGYAEAAVRHGWSRNVLAMGCNSLPVGWLVKGVGSWWHPASAASPSVWWMATGSP